MDITKFNRELANKVAMAKVAERNNEIDVAIKIWLEISDMALKFSKSKTIDTSFRNMLLKRIEGIIQHVKNLKSGKIEKEIIEENIAYIDEELEKIEEPQENHFTREPTQKTNTKSPISNQPNNLEADNLKNLEFIEDSKLKNLPNGFKEIKAPEDFTIVTPHDEDYMKKLVEKEKDVNMDIFMQKKENSTNNKEIKPVQIDFEQSENGKTLVCFACGYNQNPPKAKKCKNCGIDLN